METQKTSIAMVLAQKLANHIATHSVRQLLWQLVELAVGVFFGALLISPDGTLELIRSGLTYSDYAPLKIMAVMALFFHRKTIIKKVRLYTNKTVAKHVQKDVNKSGEKLIDNIPVTELVDYLVRNNHFRREGVNGVRSTFGLNMEKFNALAKKLEENGVLIRGENNGRILDDKWSRQSLIDYLSGVQKSIDLIPRFRIHRIGGKIRLDKNEIMA